MPSPTPTPGEMPRPQQQLQHDIRNYFWLLLLLLVVVGCSCFCENLHVNHVKSILLHNFPLLANMTKNPKTSGKVVSKHLVRLIHGLNFPNPISVVAVVAVVAAAVVGSILRSNNSMLTHNMLSIISKFISTMETAVGYILAIDMGGCP